MNEQNPYASPQASLEVESAAHDFRLGGRWERLGASLIDTVIQLAIVLPVMFFGGYFSGIMQGIQPSFGKQALWSLIGFAIFVAVQGYPLSERGQTWGKQALKLKIVDLDGKTPDFLRMLLLRYGTTQAIVLVPILGSLYALVDCLFIFRDDKRCIHDHIAGTRVVVVEETAV